MPTSKTLSVYRDAWMEQSFNDEISCLLARVLEENPHQTPQEALVSVEKSLLKNNPYTPPEGNQCPINNLPNELLASIFQSGVNLQYEELEERNGDDDEPEWEDVDNDEDDNGDDHEEDGADEGQYDTESTGSSEGTEESDDNDDEEIHDFQVLVSHVCRRWRSLTLVTSNLWTILSFSKNPKVEKAMEYIIRSKDLPLTVYFDSSFAAGLSQEHHDSQVSQFFDLIEPEISRWRTFTYRRHPKRDLESLMSRLEELPEARLLESFRILYSSGYEAQHFSTASNRTCIPFHGHAPKLKEAVLWGVNVDWDSSFFHGLRRLEMASYLLRFFRPSYVTFVQMIKSSPKLHTLALSFAGPNLLDSMDADFLTIPSLRNLLLQTDHPQYVAALVQRLNLPNLHTLGLNLVAGDYSSFIRALSTPGHGQTQSLLQTISCLTIFGLSCETASSVELLLAQLVALKTLQIESLYPQENATIVEKLTMPAATRSESPNSSDEVFCPKLEELAVSEWNGEKLRAIINARRNAGVPLKKMVIRKSALSMQDIRWIRKNVEHLVLY